MRRGGARRAALLAVAAAMTTPAAAQVYHPGQVCWPETPCPGATGAVAKAVRAPRPKPTAGSRKPRNAGLNAPRPKATVSLLRSTPAVSAPRFYRYPTMYSAEAPPLLPPGAMRFAPYAQQPYVLVSQGIWYWPGANDFKMPQVPGFEPVIDPSRVLSW